MYKELHLAIGLTFFPLAFCSLAVWIFKLCLSNKKMSNERVYRQIVHFERYLTATTVSVALISILFLFLSNVLPSGN